MFSFLLSLYSPIRMCSFVLLQKAAYLIPYCCLLLITGSTFNCGEFFGQDRFPSGPLSQFFSLPLTSLSGQLLLILHILASTVLLPGSLSWLPISGFTALLKLSFIGLCILAYCLLAILNCMFCSERECAILFIITSPLLNTNSDTYLGVYLNTLLCVTFGIKP